ncbi:MAG: YihY/virulence factor BrkB family protein [Planctomycetaceae bacterium]|nr:YihY/virulence factor BrkB family protein [Planctomycetaceae bacterium]
MRIVRQLSAAVTRWQQDDGSLMAAAVAYYAALSFFPLLLILISGLSIVLQFTAWGQDAQTQVLQAIEQYASAAVRDSVAQMLQRVADNAGTGGPLGGLTLLIAAGALFAHFERAFDNIWNVESAGGSGIMAAVKNILFHRLRAFLMLLALGLLLIINLIVSFTLSGVRAYTEDYLPGSEFVWVGMQLLSGVAINTLVFSLLYWIVPKVPVRFREALQGGLLAALIWEFGRWVLASFVLGGKFGAYGVVGSFLVIMLWIYYACSVLFLGAEYVQVIRERCNQTPAEGQ